MPNNLNHPSRRERGEAQQLFPHLPYRMVTSIATAQLRGNEINLQTVAEYVSWAEHHKTAERSWGKLIFDNMIREDEISFLQSTPYDEQEKTLWQMANNYYTASIATLRGSNQINSEAVAYATAAGFMELNGLGLLEALNTYAQYFDEGRNAG